MGSALSVKNYESLADRRLAGGFLADTSYEKLKIPAISKLSVHEISCRHQSTNHTLSPRDRTRPLTQSVASAAQQLHALLQ